MPVLDFDFHFKDEEVALGGVELEEEMMVEVQQFERVHRAKLRLTRRGQVPGFVPISQSPMNSFDIPLPETIEHRLQLLAKVAELLGVDDVSFARFIRSFFYVL